MSAQSDMAAQADAAACATGRVAENPCPAALEGVAERYARSAAAYPDITGGETPGRSQARLEQGRVALIGCGGLGGYVLELLARSGVGYIRVVDGDRFSASNLNRQCLCTQENLGRYKVSAAVDRAGAVNSSVIVDAVPAYADEGTLPGLLQGVHLVVDALDNVPDRRMLARAAACAGIPLVHGAVAGFLGQVTVLYPGDTAFEQLYPPHTHDTPPLEHTVGVASPTPALVASVQTAEVIKLLLGQHSLVLRNRLFICDLGLGYAQVVDLRLQHPAASQPE